MTKTTQHDRMMHRNHLHTWHIQPLAFKEGEVVEGIELTLPFVVDPSQPFDVTGTIRVWMEQEEADELAENLTRAAGSG
jgi:hypothetical protein